MPNDKGKNGNNIYQRMQEQDKRHYKATERYAVQIERLYKTAADEFARLGASITDPGDAGFSFDRFPKAKKRAQAITATLARKVQAVIGSGVRSEWLAACQKNDAFISSILHTSRLTKEEAEQYMGRNLEALKTFQGRKVQGMDISQRVWKYVGDLKEQMELGIDVGLGEGKSAQELSRDLRSYLQEPERLYRRVRDKDGILRLSKAASLYNPGQGIYRSSAKNAARLARTEINMAYRESDWLRWQQLDFVVGIRIHLSNNHTTKDNKGKTVPLTDMCDELYGDYPKAFKFTGWHPQCRCFVTPITKDYDELNKDTENKFMAIVKKQDYKALPSRRAVKDVPARFRTYIASISDRARGWKSMPYYIRDNFKGGTIEGGLKGTIPTQTMNEVEPCTEFDEQIAHLRKWAHALGLDLSAIESLRTAGNRVALEAEIERLRQIGEERQNEWRKAWNELKDFAENKTQGIAEVVKEAEAVLKANEVKATHYYGNSISNLMTAASRMAAKLKSALFYNYSPNMPQELKAGGKWLRGEDYKFSKKFFDLIDPKKPITLTITKGNGTSGFNPSTKKVNFYNGNRAERSAYHRKALVYHEFGHGIDDQRGLKADTALLELRKKHIEALSKRVQITKIRMLHKDAQGKIVTTKITTSIMRGQQIDERLMALDKKIYFMSEGSLKKLGINKWDTREQIAKVRDTLKSLINTIGDGHEDSYFAKAGNSEAEYLAHAFENAFIGNRVFQKYLPDEYAEMIAYIRGLK